jgi:predicted TIM-barrel fold metal-dependent hydrolase
VLFPDFGLPFELYPSYRAAVMGAERTPGQVEAGNKAHNRWVADFCASSYGRLGGMAVVSFADVEDTVREIHWAKENGLIGAMLPTLDEKTPFFHERHEPIWNTLEELEMPVTTHTGMSAVSRQNEILAREFLKTAPHTACMFPMHSVAVFFYTQQILTHLIWGGVLERHPNLQVNRLERRRTGRGLRFRLPT